MASLYNLSKEEELVLYYWSKGKSKIESYKSVMLTASELDRLTEAAIRKRVNRFFSTYRIREAMDKIDRRGGKGQEEFEVWQQRQREAMSRQLDPDMAKIKDRVRKEIANVISEVQQTQTGDDNQGSEDKSVKDDAEEIMKKIMTKSKLERIEKEVTNATKDAMTDKQKWLASLQVSSRPTALTIFGTGQFLTYVAIKEIFDRQAAIKERNIDVFDKNGSVLTPNIISALKTAAAMIIPYAPAPTDEDRHAMSKAAVLLGLMPDQIQEDPDDYTAPPPVIIDVTDKE